VADHDTTANVFPVERLIRGRGPGFIRAVEVSATLEGHLYHLLGYGIDPQDRALTALLEENWRKLTSVDDQSIEKLIAAGHDISWDDYASYENDPTRGGWRALNYLIDRGVCRDVNDFFGRLFVGEMALCYPMFADPARVVQVIVQAGGLTICAHPGHRSDKDEMGALDKLVDCGIRGLECYSPYHDDAATRTYVDFCRRRGLLITAGSDCHGGFVGRSLGMPEAYLSDLSLGPLLDAVIT
jgi:predicted metal-dependent phosphoesterase TrpH